MAPISLWRRQARCMALLALCTLASGAAYGDPADAGYLLRKYCKACHAVGDYRFINSENSDEVWEDIHILRTANGRLYAHAIAETLRWPSGATPAAETEVRPGHQYMPIGAKRSAMARATVGGVGTRSWLVHELENRIATDIGVTCQGGQLVGRVPLGNVTDVDSCQRRRRAARSPYVCCLHTQGYQLCGLDGETYGSAGDLTQCLSVSRSVHSGLACAESRTGWQIVRLRNYRSLGPATNLRDCSHAVLSAADESVCTYDSARSGWRRTHIPTGRMSGSSQTLEQCISG